MERDVVRRVPRRYQAEIDVRFTDFDLYGHVNAGRYLDFVTCSRVKFMETSLGLGMEDCREKGILFFLRHSKINYVAAIESVGPVAVSSFVESMRGPLLTIPFEIRSNDDAILYCEGELQVVVLDRDSRKPRRVRGWVEDLFFHPLTPQDDQMTDSPVC